MISDGRIVDRALRKLQCRCCGTIRHAEALTDAEISAIYAGSYALPGLTGDGQVADYAAEVAKALPPGAPCDSLLDIGCGSGALLRRLAGVLRPTTAIGVDPAATPDACGPGPVRILRGTAADLPAEAQFDLIVSVNTIEHVADPQGFLATVASRLTQRGTAIVICPAIAPSNDELLFFDHIWTFPPTALSRIATRVGLTLDRTSVLGGRLEGFSLYRLCKAGIAADVAPLTGTPARYLGAWSQLEDRLGPIIDRAGVQVDAFGAGQMAALVRTYAPVAFARCRVFLVDDVASAWPIGRVEAYAAERIRGGRPVLCLVHPRSFGAVAARIHADGGLPLALPLDETPPGAAGGQGGWTW
jgi:SAM-dependent methyltransferase